MEPDSILCAHAHADISFILVSFVNHFFEPIYSTLARLGLQNAEGSPRPCSLGNCTTLDVCCAAGEALNQGADVRQSDGGKGSASVLGGEKPRGAWGGDGCSRISQCTMGTVCSPLPQEGPEGVRFGESLHV